MTGNEDERPYTGLSVLDLGQGIAAPYCAMLLAMHGAAVVKLEPPGGDWSRGLGARRGDHTAMSTHYNRGKRSLALDLASPAGREIAFQLAGRADILVEGFRPGVMDRLGLGWERLHEANPRLLYVSVTGFGRTGPYADLPCTDSVAQAFSGLMSLNRGNDGAPHRVGAYIIDTLTGLYAAQATGVALYRRERTGNGQRVEVGLAECAAAILGHRLGEHLLEGGKPLPPNVPTGAYATRDGWIIIALLREDDYRRLAAALGRADLGDDPRFADFAGRAAHAAECCAAVGATFRTHTTEVWLERLRAADLLCNRVNGFEDWLADPHVVASGGAVAVAQPGLGEFRMPRTPGVPAAVDAAMPPAPAIGEHGAAILAELGYEAAAIARLAAEAILRQPR
jgi:crotonobetainyl-CoA:carnitine CoA-transferase CaiB-like acyl-CoA transferase